MIDNLIFAKVSDLPEEFHPTDMHWLPRSGGQGGKGKGAADTFLLTSAEGKLQLVGKGGRLEKPVDAHR